jgi:hypothetical protein
MHARLAGGDLVLAAPQQQVLRVLTLTRLIEVFPVHASVDEAAGGGAGVGGRAQRCGAGLVQAGANRSLSPSLRST